MIPNAPNTKAHQYSYKEDMWFDIEKMNETNLSQLSKCTNIFFVEQHIFQSS